MCIREAYIQKAKKIAKSALQSQNKVTKYGKNGTSAVRSKGEMLPPDLVRPQPETKPDLVLIMIIVII